MAVSVTVLGSGSGGNCTVLSTSRTRILVDAGFSCREIRRRMAEAGLDSSSLDAIIVSHEHTDHVTGIYQMSKKLNPVIYMTEATHYAWRRMSREKNGSDELQRFEKFEAGKRVVIGDIEVLPFTIPHDAADPVGFKFKAEGATIAIATDLGHMTRNVVDHLRGCDLLMIESNHDLEMLKDGPYPWAVKQRVLSRVGHLSNEALAEFLAADYDGSAAYVVLAHLSEANNHPEIARREAERALAQRQTLLQNQLLLASQNDWLQPITF